MIQSIIKRKVIYDFDEFCIQPPTKKALVSYLVHPVLPPPKYRDKVLFSNRGIAQQICYALNELGYSVDIVDFQNTTWMPSKQYDLFIGHGGTNFERFLQRLDKSTKKIYFSTGAYWKDANIREAQRFYELALRTGYFLPPDRFNVNSEEIANHCADGIICLGNANTRKSYQHFSKVININNAAYPIDYDVLPNKDYSERRKHFLFFSGRGNVHKGLDLLLDAFADTDLHLHICQHLEPDFKSVYHQKLFEQANIHFAGFIKMRSPRFLELVKKCCWVILPTCSEGQPGSVIECMAHGLVPILPQEANIDLDAWGFEIPALKIDEIRELAIKASNLEEEDYLARSQAVIDTVISEYSVERFRSCFKEAVLTILAAEGNEIS